MTSGWQARLGDGHVEVFVKAPGLKLRAHGTEAQMNELLDWFESQTGHNVSAPWRKRKGPSPMPGQGSLLELLREETAEGAHPAGHAA